MVFDYFINSFLEDYIRGMFTETLGIFLTIILIEIILLKSKNDLDFNTAKKELDRFNNLLTIYINNYEDVAFNIAYKYSDYNTQRKKGIEKDFLFNNLEEFHLSSLSLFDGHNESKAEVYFKGLDNLKETIKDIVLQVDLTHFPDLSNLLEIYIKYVEKHYPKNSILCDVKTQNNGTFLLPKKMIKEHKGLIEYKKHNIINSYVRLHELIIYHILFIEKYKIIVKKYKIS